jgi:hypothetical protein
MGNRDRFSSHAESSLIANQFASAGKNISDSSGVFHLTCDINMQVVKKLHSPSPEIHMSVHKFLRLLSYTASYI